MIWFWCARKSRIKFPSGLRAKRHLKTAVFQGMLSIFTQHIFRLQHFVIRTLSKSAVELEPLMNPLKHRLTLMGKSKSFSVLKRDN